MVTFELAIGILSAMMVAVVMCWGIHLIAVQTECADIAAQVARAEARGDSKASSQARKRAPTDAVIDVRTTANGAVEVRVTVQAKFGSVLSMKVTGSAVMPKEPGR